ncbi:unnamed protein product [Paramecium primaurelia]|uniref:ATP-grasp domain-containing protein n=1 Tax=Paramecium primaurelia TaxID=5886 RepID=A0A8S1K8X8_PARPR|nr:unnamed protein product [Paramecium primaurelia]
MSYEKITILFMINPDPIFYGMMDQLIIETFQKLKVNLIITELEELSVIIGNENKYNLMHFQHMDTCLQNITKITCILILLHILLKKLHFINLPQRLPRCGASFSLNTFKENLRRFNNKSIIKEVLGYEGTGVKLSINHNQSMELFCKSMWNGEQAIIQDFVDDTIGRSIRVLVIGGKAVSVTEFQDNVDFKSNGYSDDFTIESKMDSDKKCEYFQIAEKACAAIDPHLTIGGVDILDSMKNGMVVLEINSWPEMTFSQEATGLPLLGKFGYEFIEKIIYNNRDRTNST